MAFWKIFQRSADAIDKWDYPEKWKPTVQALNDMIPKVIRDSVLTYLGDEYKKHKYKAKDKVKEVVEKLTEILDDMK